MVIYKDDKKFSEFRYKLEEDFEKEVVTNSKLFFGKNTIIIDSKRKIDSKSFGGSIPDAFLFDFSDIENPEFYIIEVELRIHDFFNHIFPQITKFFAFFKNSKSQKELIEKIYSIISTDEELKKGFKKFIGEREIYKFLNDTIENSRNILLILDGEKIELPEIIETYSDTWGKLVKVQIIKKYVNNQETAYSMEPDFENIEYNYIQQEATDEGLDNDITEEYHLEDVDPQVKALYYRLKENILGLNSGLIFNPQKYYISVRNSRNIVFLKFRKKKIRMIVMLPFETITSKIKKHQVKSLSQSVRDFYNGECAAIDVVDLNDLGEIVDLVRELV